MIVAKFNMAMGVFMLKNHTRMSHKIIPKLVRSKKIDNELKVTFVAKRCEGERCIKKETDQII